MIVVSDASPIISLSAVGHFELLRQLYQRIAIAESVREEILRAGAEKPGIRELGAADWVTAYPVPDSLLVRALDGDLDRGEAESIALAIQLGADIVLLDERRGRSIAQRFDLKVVGVVGVLIEAKAKGFIPKVGPVLNELLGKAGFRLSLPLYEHVMRAVGELPVVK